MDKRLFLVVATLAIAAGVAYVVWPAVSSASKDSAGSPPPMDRPAAAPKGAEPTTGEPVVVPETAPPETEPTALVTDPASPDPVTADADGEIAPVVIEPLPAVVGDSPAPTSGKPVAAVDIAWNLQPDPVTPGLYRGSVTAVNKAGEGQVVIQAVALGAVTLVGVAESEARTWQRGETVVLPLAAQLMGSAGQAEVVITVRVEGAGRRSRIISVLLRSPEVAQSTVPTTVPADTPDINVQKPVGEHILIDSDGQPIHFTPAAGEPQAP